jgi:hypothetical protein
MKRNITISAVGILLAASLGATLVSASVVTGTISSGAVSQGQTQTSTSGSFSGTVTGSQVGANFGGGGGGSSFLSGTVSGGSSGNSSGGGFASNVVSPTPVQSSGRAVVALNTADGISPQDIGEGTATLTDGNASTTNPNANQLAAVVTSGASLSWLWWVLLALVLILGGAYFYNRSITNQSKRKS